MKCLYYFIHPPSAVTGAVWQQFSTVVPLYALYRSSPIRTIPQLPYTHYTAAPLYALYRSSHIRTIPQKVLRLLTADTYAGELSVCFETRSHFFLVTGQ